jgi:outer membrane protein insertion porin family
MPTYTVAQLEMQGPQSTYDGQNVAYIDLIANPHRNLDSLQKVVLQKAGQPYLQENVEASIKALQQTGQFPKVEVNIVPEIAGLRLEFLLEAPYYLGLVSFPGATTHFSYTRLSQVVDLPDQEPYGADRLPAAARSLQEFLRSSGYFQCAVRTSSEIDDAHQIVNVNFEVTLGPRARIGTVTFEGAPAVENRRLQRSIRSLRARFTGGLLKTGKGYAPERITSATSIIKRTLSQQGFLASKVKELPPTYHPETNRADISFDITTGPTVLVRVVGARLTLIPFLSKRELKKLIPVYSEGIIDRDLVEEGQQNLIDYFQKKGYFDVKVTTDFQSREKKTLVYSIDKGKKHKVEAIAFHGNYHIPERDLVVQVVVKKAHFWSHGLISEKLLAQSAKNIDALYADRGYEEAKVVPNTSEQNNHVNVVFQITENSQTVIRNVNVTGNRSLTPTQLTAPIGFQLQPGKAFSPRLLADDRNRIAANYLNRGYLNVEVKPTVERPTGDPHGVSVTYNITEHQLVRVGDVIYLGQNHTKLSLIRKAARIPTESPMRRGDLLAAESRLYDLNIFDWASVGPRKPITDQTEEDAVVKVHEAKRTDIIYGFGFEISHRGGNIPTGTVGVPGLPAVQLGKYQIAPSQATYASPQGSIELDRLNMRGMGETASASLLLSRLDQRALTSYTQPHFLGTNWRSLSSFSLERTTENPLFAAGLGDASFQLERLLNRKTNSRFQIRYDFNKTSLSDLLVPALVLQQDRNIHLSTVSGTFIRDTRDKPLDAHHGSFTTVNLGVTPVSLGSSASFAKLFGQYALYKPVHSIVFADSIRLGFAKSYAGSFVPTSQLFFSGGGTTLRGFPIDEAGPQRLVPFCNVLQGQSGCVNINVPVGGRQLFILNSEARFPLGIIKALGGVIFYDGGNVYSAINFNNFVNNYTNTVGVGLRYATPIGPIRFDIGKNLNPIPGIGSVQYYITLGQAF